MKAEFNVHFLGTVPQGEAELLKIGSSGRSFVTLEVRDESYCGSSVKFFLDTPEQARAILKLAEDALRLLATSEVDRLRERYEDARAAYYQDPNSENATAYDEARDAYCCMVSQTEG